MKTNRTITVLLLEDNRNDYEIAVRQLRSQRYRFEVDWAATLSEALALLGQYTYDVVLSDLNVPDSAGLDTVSRLKKHCFTTPIIVLTGVDDEDSEGEIIDAGAHDYLLKGELCGRLASRAIVSSVLRQQATNKQKSLVTELENSQRLLKEQAELLQNKNKRLSQLYDTAQEFVDNVSHDFRTPLTVIKDYVNIVREGMVGEISPQQNEMLGKVSVRADDLNNMVDDMLDISKLEAGLLCAWRRDVSVAEIMNSAEALLSQRAQVRRVELQVDCEANLSEVYCDAEKAVRVITNLAVNAIKFAGVPGKVRLWAESDAVNQQVVIGVTDNGPGIDSRSIERIFQRFQQLDTGIRSTLKGYGLGLNIAQQLCRLNLGELGVQSQVGKGSTFSFTLPLANPREVFSRWLSLHTTCQEALRVVEVTIPDNSTTAEADEFDSFLSCLLRRDDLLLRTASQRWLLVMADLPSQECGWRERAANEFDKSNRNRPLGPLPAYKAEICCEWRAAEGGERIAKQFDQLLVKDSSKPILRPEVFVS